MGDTTNTVNLLGGVMCGNIQKKIELKQRKEKMIQEELQ